MYQAMDHDAILEGVKKFGPAVGSRKMMDWEQLHAQEALDSKLYITYWCESKKMECGRLGSNSKCFCGHFFKDHKKNITSKKIDTACLNCPCKIFQNIPQRPEECGMWWLPRRKEFDITKWRPKCKCSHTHEEHSCTRPLRCTKCRCMDFISDFACISCDRLWEDHVVLYETERERIEAKKPVGREYLPLSNYSELQKLVFPKAIKQQEPDNHKDIEQEEQKLQGNPFSNSKPVYTTAYTRPRSNPPKALMNNNKPNNATTTKSKAIPSYMIMKK